MKHSVENLALWLKTYNYECILVVSALFFAYVFSRVLMKNRNNLPPRVKGLPIVGYLPYMTKDIHLDFMQLRKKYGDVFSVKIGSQDVVVLNGADVIREAFNKPEFLGRPSDSALQKVVPSSAFFGNDTLLWREQRRTVFQFMKDLGLGTTKLEEDILEEIYHFMVLLKDSNTQPIDIGKPMYFSIMNNICSLVIGKRFEYDDPKLQFLEKNREEFFKHFDKNYLDVLFPWIRYIPFASKFLLCNKSKSAIENYQKFLQVEVNEHLKSLNPAHIRDFMDRYIVEIDKQKTKHPNSSFSLNMLITNCIDLLLGAGDTVHSTFLWLIYIIAAFPDVQKKVQKEIIEVIGLHRKPEYMDIRNLPYTHAVMLETMRWKCVIPLIFPHCTLAHTTVDGYSIPKGTAIVPNLWAAMHDPRIWEDAEKFKPERFLNKDGISVVKSRYFIPFFLGKRSCPGEPMANLELFLYFTCVLRDFDIAFPDKTKPTFKGNFFTFYRSQPYLVRFFKRTDVYK